MKPTTRTQNVTYFCMKTKTWRFLCPHNFVEQRCWPPFRGHRRSRHPGAKNIQCRQVTLLPCAVYPIINIPVVCWALPWLHYQFLLDSLRWRHNGQDSVSNHQPYYCLLNRLFRRRSKKTSKLRVTGLCAGNSPGTGEFPAQMASNAENVSIWWRHHVMRQICPYLSGLLHGTEAVAGLSRCQWSDPELKVKVFPKPMKQPWRIWIKSTVTKLQQNSAKRKACERILFTDCRV